MSEQRVLRIGNPLLHEVAEQVSEFGTPPLRELVVDLWDTMAARGGVGIAAPQIGVGLRVVVFAMRDHPLHADPESIPQTVLINPVIEPMDDTIEDGWEGCLSVPGMRGLVPRYQRIHYMGRDVDGAPIDREVEGFHARVVQHECDHLDGVLYPQRIRDMAQFGFEEEISLAGKYTQLEC